MPDPYYQRHIFFCLNDRDKGEKSCAHDGAADGLRPLQVAGEEGRPARSPARCASTRRAASNRCAGGPVAVVYPEGVWYTYVDHSDIDEIVDSHLKRGEVVTRLLLPPDVGR